MDPASSFGDDQNLKDSLAFDQKKDLNFVSPESTLDPSLDYQSQNLANSSRSESPQTFTNNASFPVNPPTQLMASKPPPSESPSSQNMSEESTYAVFSPTPQKPPHSKKKFVLLVIFLFLFFIFSGSGVAYAIAYGRIKLKNYPDLQRSIANLVISIPFMPKTPEFVLTKSLLAHQEVTKQTFDVSLAIESDDLASQIGISTIDVAAKGALDRSDPRNIKFWVDASITKEFNFEARKADKILFFKVNKLPTFLLSALGMKPEIFDPVLKRWIAYDTTPLDTEARRSLEGKEVNPLSREYIEENFNKYIDEKVLEKMRLETVTEDGVELFKITLEADPAFIDHFDDKLDKETIKDRGAPIGLIPEKPIKLSEIIKSMRWEFYFDKKAYYNKKTMAHFDVEVDRGESFNPFLMGTTGFSSEKSKVTFVFAMKSDKFGEDVVVEVPEDAMTFEEFTNSFSEIMRTFYTTILTPPEPFSPPE